MGHMNSLDQDTGLAIAHGHPYVVEVGKGQLLAIDLTSGDTKTVAHRMKFSTGKLNFEDTENWARSSMAITGKTAYIGGARTGSVYKVGL